MASGTATSRVEIVTSPLRVKFGDFELHEADARLRRTGVPVPLPPKALGVLCTLLRNPGTLVTKNALLDEVWGHQHVSESVLKTVISQVRSALDDDATSPRFIQTASRRGYRFIGTISIDSGRPAPEPSKSPRPEFIGRVAELRKLSARWESVQQGKQSLVWIAGDAGIGKSTLVEEFVSRSGAAAIAQGLCIEQFGAGESYMPILQGLTDLCRTYPDLIPMMRTCAPTWLLQLPWLLNETERATLARELAGISSERMLREFQQLMIHFTARQPLLLVVEDLHWADIATLRLMDHFARHRNSGRVLWLATFRLTQVIAEEHPLQRIRQELRAHQLCEEVLLDCFTEAEVQEYLHVRSMTAGHSEDFVRRVHAHTDGLPLFVANVAEALKSPASGVSTTSELPVPEDLVDAVERRIALLEPEIIALLEAAATSGSSFRARVVASMLGRTFDEVLISCDRLVRQQYWLTNVSTLDLADGSLDAEYAFRHAIYRHAFYRRIGNTQRLASHRRCARALKEGVVIGATPSYAELAYHHEQGHEALDAIVAYTQAARHSLRSFTPRVAYVNCERALRLLPQVQDDNQRQSLELSAHSARGVAAAQMYGVGSDESRQIFERVRELCEQMPQHPAWGALASGYGGSLFQRGEYSKLEALAERLEGLQRDDLPTLPFFSSLFRAFAVSARGECRAATELWIRTIGICETIKDRSAYDGYTLDPEVGARSNSLRTFFERGMFDRAKAEAIRAVTLAEQLGQPLSQMLAYWRAGMLEVRFENPQGVLKHAEKLHEIAETSTVTQGLGAAYYLQGWAVARLGDPKRGLGLIQDGIERKKKVGGISNSTEVLGYAAEAMLLAGDWDGAELQVSQAFDRARELGEWPYAPMLTLLSARAAQGRADSALALERMREAVRQARQQEAPGFELKAACWLVEHPGSMPDDRTALASLLKTLPGGAVTPDTLRARALLA